MRKPGRAITGLCSTSVQMTDVCAKTAGLARATEGFVQLHVVPWLCLSALRQRSWCRVAHTGPKAEAQGAW